MYLNKIIKKAYKVLEGKELDFDLALELINLESDDVSDLISLANKVTRKFATQEHICSIMSAKSGRCSENCRFCAQSAHYNTGISTFKLVSAAEMLKEAKIAYESGVEYFGIVTSGKGYKNPEDPEFKEIIAGLRLIRNDFPDKNVCCTIGVLSEKTADELKEAGIAHYNINFQTNPERYAELISTTHTIEEKIKTIKLLKERNIKVCAGGIIGLGESAQDRVKLAFALKVAEADSIPINVLIPIKGTPLEKIPALSVLDIVKTFAVFRLINPDKVIKIAAGRETIMKDYQALIMLAGANGFLTGGYLTTRGREVAEDLLFKKEISSFR